jgi:hypothetical protein
MVDKVDQDQKPKKPPYVLPESIRKYYSKYRNKTPLQTFNVLGTIFEIDSNYEILDSSDNIFSKFPIINHNISISWKRFLWDSRGSKRQISVCGTIIGSYQEDSKGF